MIIDSLGGVTTQMLTAGLNVAMARHQVIANNIANANTPGYAAREADFAQLFQSAYAQLGSGRAGGGFGTAPVFSATGTVTGGGVELDAELAKLGENNLRYQVLLRGLGRHVDNLAYVIADGRK